MNYRFYYLALVMFSAVLMHGAEQKSSGILCHASKGHESSIDELKALKTLLETVWTDKKTTISAQAVEALTSPLPDGKTSVCDIGELTGSFAQGAAKLVVQAVKNHPNMVGTHYTLFGETQDGVSCGFSYSVEITESLLRLFKMTKSTDSENSCEKLCEICLKTK